MIDVHSNIVCGCDDAGAKSKPPDTNDQTAHFEGNEKSNRVLQIIPQG
jgi:hypothetical protein